MKFLEFLINLKNLKKCQITSVKNIVDLWLTHKFSDIPPHLLDLYYNDFDSFLLLSNEQPLNALKKIDLEESEKSYLIELLLIALLDNKNNQKEKYLNFFIKMFSENQFFSKEKNKHCNCLFYLMLPITEENKYKDNYLHHSIYNPTIKSILYFLLTGKNDKPNDASIGIEKLKKCADFILKEREQHSPQENSLIYTYLSFILIKLGVMLIYLDDKLSPYREDSYIDSCVEQLLITHQYIKLIEKDVVYHEVIKKNDLAVQTSLGWISGNTAFFSYFNQLEEILKFSDTLSLMPSNPNQFFSPKKNSFQIPIANGDETAIIKILNNPYPPEYKPFLVNEIFPKLSEITLNLSQAQKNIQNHKELFPLLLNEINNDCLRLNSLYEIFDLILYYTQKSSSNEYLGGEGDVNYASRDWTYKSQKLFYKCWIKWCDDKMRRLLVTDVRFRRFFSVITNRGFLFEREKNIYYDKYYPSNEVEPSLCFDGAQYNLGIFLSGRESTDSRKSRETLINIKNKFYFLESAKDGNELEKAKILKQKKEEIISFIKCVKNIDLTEITVGSSLLYKDKNTFVLLDIKCLIIKNDIKGIETLIKNELMIDPLLFYWVDQQMNIKNKTRDCLIKASVYKNHSPSMLLNQYNDHQGVFPMILLRFSISNIFVFNFENIVSLLFLMRNKHVTDLESINLLLEKLSVGEIDKLISEHLVVLCECDFNFFKVHLITAVLLKLFPQSINIIINDDYYKTIKTTHELASFVKSKKIISHNNIKLNNSANQIGISGCLDYKNTDLLHDYKTKMLSALSQAMDVTSEKFSLKNKLLKFNKKKTLENIYNSVTEIDLLDEESEARLNQFDMNIRRITKCHQSFFSYSKTNSFATYSSLMVNDSKLLLRRNLSNV